MGNSAVTARSVAFGPNAMDIKGKNVFITGLFFQEIDFKIGC